MKLAYFAIVIRILLTVPINLQAQGTAFTYQGRLDSGATPASGCYDLIFSLFDASSGGGQVGNTLTCSAIAVSNGIFTVTLDFGASFPGAARWLEIGVSTNGQGAFTLLNPRQQLTAVPYAVYSGNATTASSLTGTLSASQLTGNIGFSQLPGTVLTNNASGVILSGTFSGNGAGLTNVPAGNIAGLVANTDSSPIPFIVDDDPGGDGDGASEFAYLCQLHNMGLIRLIAAGSCTPPKTGNRGIAYYQVLGNYYGVYPLYCNTTNNNNYAQAQNWSWFVTKYYNQIQWATNAPEVVRTYRRALATASGKVVMLFTGQLNNLNDLLNSPGDEITSLSGISLVSNTVSKIVIVAGDYPSGAEWNLTTLPGAAACVSQIPANVPVVWSGYTLGMSVVQLPGYWLNSLYTSNPLCDLYLRLYGQSGRYAWGHVGITYAVFGTNFCGQQLFGLVQGYNRVNTTSGANIWQNGTQYNQFYITSTSTSVLSNLINSILVQAPPLASSFTELTASGLWTNQVAASGLK